MHQVVIEVADEGVGIPEKYMKRIFDPYFTTKAQGSGLGVAMHSYLEPLRVLLDDLEEIFPPDAQASHAGASQ